MAASGAPSTVLPASQTATYTKLSSLPAAGSSSRKNRSSNRAAGGWPRAAWFMDGLGRYGVDDMSEAPLKAPYVSLKRFITQVRAVSGAEMFSATVMYLASMQGS